jgi:hypothetical protein
MPVAFAFKKENQNMKCVQIALLLPLVFAGRATGALAANDRPTIAGQLRIALPPTWPETLRQTTPFQSRIDIDANGLRADFFSPYDFSPYDAYYANSATSAKTHNKSSVGARLSGCVQGYVSQLATYGKAVAVYASRYWKQVATYLHEREKNSAEAGLASQTRREPTEWLCVMSYKDNDGVILATLGKVTPEYRLGPVPRPALLGEFCQIDDERCPIFVDSAESAAPSQPGVGEANQGGRSRAQASVAQSVATRLQQLAKWWLGDWDVVFRNISGQIARLDWTVLLTGKPSDLAVHNMLPAPEAVKR